MAAQEEEPTWAARLQYTASGRELAEHLADVKYRSNNGGYEGAAQSAETWRRAFMQRLARTVRARSVDGDKRAAPLPFGVPDPEEEAAPAGAGPARARLLPKYVVLANLSGLRRAYWGDDSELFTELCSQSRCIHASYLERHLKKMVDALEADSSFQRSLLITYSLPKHAGWDGYYWSAHTIEVINGRIVDRACVMTSMSEAPFACRPTLDAAGVESAESVEALPWRTFITSRTIKALEETFKASEPAPSVSKAGAKSMHDMQSDVLAKLAADGLGLDPSEVQVRVGDDQLEELKRVQEKLKDAERMRELESAKLKQQFSQIRDLKMELAAEKGKLVEQCRNSASSLLGAESQFEKEQARSAEERARLVAELTESKQLADESVRLQKRLRDAAQSELALVKEDKQKLEGDLQRARQQQSAKDKLQFETGKQHAAEVRRLTEQLEAQQKAHKASLKELKEKHAQATQWMKSEHEKTKEVLATKETIADQLGKHLAEMEEKYKQDRAAAIAETDATIAEIRANHEQLQTNHTRAIEEHAAMRRSQGQRTETCDAQTYTEPYVDSKVTALEAEIARLNEVYEAAMGTSPPSGAPSPTPIVGTGPTEAAAPPPSDACASGAADDAEDYDGYYGDQKMPQMHPPTHLPMHPPMRRPLHPPPQQQPVVDAELACLAAMSSVGQLVEFTRNLNMVLNGGSAGYYQPTQPAPMQHMFLNNNMNNNYHAPQGGSPGWRQKARR